jgi:hypothetical protein
MNDQRADILAVHGALDEARFGRGRILNLRATLPRPVEAERRTESWLREQQVLKAGEVLVITGRGNQSYAGVSPVRQTVVRLFSRLKRLGVVSSVEEHTPGSFVVRLASMRALRDAPRRSRGSRKSLPAADPASLAGLPSEIRDKLRRLAIMALEALGMHAPAHAFVESEMLAQFRLIAGGIEEGPDREAKLRDAICVAIKEYDEER